MKIKNIYVEAKRSKNFQTYTVGLEAEITEDENITETVMELQARCRKLTNSELGKDDLKQC